MKNVRFLQVIKLVAAPDEAGRRKAAASKIGKENIVGNQAGHGHNPPPGRGIEHLAQSAEIGDPVRGDPESAEPVEKLVARTTDQ